ncbi:MAG: hypothetical protein A2X46_17790 [Lentisphaerae bacterium GWF2_57_35]|nr:MAG: hypothetical protein A2X46_17790 [Lentisphaerae bacterium GWF2_57_35]
MGSKEKTKVLVVYYSQTGQLRNVLGHLVQPLLKAPDVDVVFEELVPERPYPFPWTLSSFFDALPDCIDSTVQKVMPLKADTAVSWDLIILGYPAWFLRPAPPIQAFLASEPAQKLFRGKPVVTVAACRGMWIMAQEQIKRGLEKAQGVLTDHVAVVDQGNAVASIVTTVRWMLTGNKGAWLGLFPPAGIHPDEIQRCSRFGDALLTALRQPTWPSQRPYLRGLGAVKVDPRLIASEKIGHAFLRFFGRALAHAGPAGSWRRRIVLGLFLALFIPLIVVMVPIRMVLLRALQPLLRTRLHSLKRQFEEPSGSDESSGNPLTNL